MTALLKIADRGTYGTVRSMRQGDVLVPANFNCGGQIVVAGTVPAIERAEEAWTASKARN